MSDQETLVTASSRLNGTHNVGTIDLEVGRALLCFNECVAAEASQHWP